MFSIWILYICVSLERTVTEPRIKLKEWNLLQNNVVKQMINASLNITNKTSKHDFRITICAPWGSFYPRSVLHSPVRSNLKHKIKVFLYFFAVAKMRKISISPHDISRDVGHTPASYIAGFNGSQKSRDESNKAEGN